MYLYTSCEIKYFVAQGSVWEKDFIFDYDEFFLMSFFNTYNLDYWLDGFMISYVYYSAFLIFILNKL